jgi:ubiquinone/menaquinone biosynthesis C-methylase UbiE
MMKVADYINGSTDAGTKEALSWMERDWDARAREAPEFYVATAQQEWSAKEFFESGEMNVNDDIIGDEQLIKLDRNCSEMRVLEIGCGAGRMTRAMAACFREVHAVDVSAEMIALARNNLAGLQNVFLYKNNGKDLSELADQSCEFAFSFIVFQHIPVRGVIDTYIREVHRCLKPGSIFKFQVQGDTSVPSSCCDTWVGVAMSLNDARALAKRHGFEMLHASGESSQYFWLWFLKPKRPWIPTPIRRIGREALIRVRSAMRRPIRILFSTHSVPAGGLYRVRIPDFPGQAIDIGFDLAAKGSRPRRTGFVYRWCVLDSRGEAPIPVPAEHPSGVVRITKVRSRSAGSRWYRAAAAIEVTAAGGASGETLK